MEDRLPPQKILIILMGSLGDVLRGLSLLKPIKEADQEYQVTWLVDSRWRTLLEGHPFIDHLIVLERPLQFQNLKSLVFELSSQKFDIVFDLQRIFKSGILSFLTRSPCRLAFHRRNSKELNYLFNNEQIPYFPESFPKINHYHQFLEKIGISSKEPYQFCLDYLRHEPISNFSKTNHTIGVVLESSWESKDWFLESYVKLIDLLLRETKSTIVLLGTKKSEEWSKKIEKQFDYFRVISLVGKTNLRQLSTVVSQMDLVVGPDSGPGHLSSAMDVKYITIFGPTAPDRVAPYGAKDLSIEASLECRPCYKKSCPLSHKNCLKLITPEIVFQKIQKFISA